jgi:hypothetical protein
VSTLGALVLAGLAIYFFAMGISSLKDSSNHSEYGVQSESLHRKFSWFFILLAIICGLISAALAAN